MAKVNGRKNGRRTQTNPKSLANLRPAKKGNKLAAGPRSKGLFTSLEQFFDKHTDADGKIRQSDLLAELVGGMALGGPQHKTNDPNWRACVQTVFDRLAPTPREPQVVIGNVNVEQTTIAATFVDQIREATGRKDVTSHDVLRALESETFGDG